MPVLKWPHPSFRRCKSDRPREMEVRKLTESLSSCSTQKSSPHTLLEFQKYWPCGYKHRRSVMTTHLLCGSMDEGELFSPNSSILCCRGRPGFGVLRAGELTLPLTPCSTEESRHCTSPGQNTRVDFGGRGTGGLVLRI